MVLRRLPLVMESSVSLAIKAGAPAGPDLLKIIEKNQGARAVAADDKKIKIGTMVRLLYPDHPIYGIVIEYQDPYHVMIHWNDGYIFPVHVGDLEIVSLV